MKFIFKMVIFLKKNTEERRLDLLKHEGFGLLRSEIVKVLAQKYRVSMRTIYNDFKTRSDWQGNLVDMRNHTFLLLNRHEQIYRKAAYQYAIAENFREKLTALKLMVMINRDRFKLIDLKDFQQEIVESQENKGINFEALNADVFLAVIENFMEFELKKILSEHPELYATLRASFKKLFAFANIN